MEETTDLFGLKEPTSLEELEKDFEPCGGFLRRKNCSPKNPSILLNANDVLLLAIKFAKETK